MVVDNEEINNLIRYSGRTVNVYQMVPGSVLLLGSHIYRYDIASGKVDVIKEEEGEDFVGTILPVSLGSRTSYFAIFIGFMHWITLRISCMPYLLVAGIRLSIRFRVMSVVFLDWQQSGAE